LGGGKRGQAGLGIDLGTSQENQSSLVKVSGKNTNPLRGIPIGNSGRDYTRNERHSKEN
jgi:hypothetical protein